MIPQDTETTIVLLERALLAERKQAQHARQQLAEVAAVLKAFYRAEITISSMQPVLALAVQLNPELRLTVEGAA